VEDETGRTPTVPSPGQQPPVRGWIDTLKHHWGVLVAIVVPVVTVLTLVLPLIVDANHRVTSAQTLQVGTPSGAPTRQGVGAQAAVHTALNARELEGESVGESFPDAYWRVSADAPWNTLPADAGDGGSSCSTAQLAWLDKWGQREIADVWNGYLSLTNTASDGSSMSIKNIHSVGTFVTPKSPQVAVECATGIGGFSTIIALKQTLGSSSPAVYLDDSSGGQPGAPASINIAPGQYDQVWVDFDRGKHLHDNFTGDLVADVVVGDTTTHTVLFKGLTREGAVAITTTSLTIASGTFECGSSQIECTLAEFVAELKADPAYTG
jgi:hypothetical protein